MPNVQDRAALVALGKVFFWDMQAGSEGRIACGTCHFHAGADHRPQNQISHLLHESPAESPAGHCRFPLAFVE